jgi:hypothetical protein
MWYPTNILDDAKRTVFLDFKGHLTWEEDKYTWLHHHTDTQFGPTFLSLSLVGAVS